MDEIEAVVRQLYEHYNEEFGVPDFVSGVNSDDWGPQKKVALTKKNLTHPRVRKGRETRPFSAWFQPEGRWMAVITGRHFEHDKNRYQVVFELDYNYTKGF